MFFGYTSISFLLFVVAIALRPVFLLAGYVYLIRESQNRGDTDTGEYPSPPIHPEERAGVEGRVVSMRRRPVIVRSVLLYCNTQLVL